MSVLEQFRCIWMRLNTLTDPWRWPPEVTVESRFKLLGGADSFCHLPRQNLLCCVYSYTSWFPQCAECFVLEWGTLTQIPPSCRDMHRNGSICLFCAQFFSWTASLHSEFIIGLCFAAPTSGVQQIDKRRKIQLGMSYPTLPDFHLDRYVAPWKWKVDKALMCK